MNNFAVMHAYRKFTDVSEYVDISYKVSERKYTAWPSGFKEVFSSARTLKTGNPVIKLTKGDK